MSVNNSNQGRKNNLNLAVICNFPFPYGMAATNRIISYSVGMVEEGHKIKIYIYRPTEKRVNIINKKYKGNYKNINYEYPNKTTIRSSNKIVYAFELFLGIISISIKILHDSKKQKITHFIISSDWIIILSIFHLLSKFQKSKSIFIFDEYPKPIRKYLANDIPSYKKALYKRILKNFNGFISITENLNSYYQEIIKKRINYIIVPAIVETYRFNAIKKSNKKEEYICYMGNLELQKDNVDNIIRAFKMINEKFPKLYFKIFGKANSSQMKYLKTLIKELGLSEKILLLGNISRDSVPQILMDSKILVSSQPMTKRADGGFPTKLGEYLSTGVPVLLTDVGEISKYIHDKVNGFLVPPENPDLYADKLLYILNNYNIACEAAKKGKLLVNSEYSYKFQAKRIINFLMSI